MTRTHIGTAGAIALVIAALMSTSALAGQVLSGSGEVVTSGSGLPVVNNAPLCDPLALQPGICLDSRADRLTSFGGASAGSAGSADDNTGGGDNGEGGGNDNGEGTDGSDGGEGGDGTDGPDGGEGGDPNQR